MSRQSGNVALFHVEPDPVAESPRNDRLDGCPVPDSRRFVSITFSYGVVAVTVPPSAGGDAKMGRGLSAGALSDWRHGACQGHL